MVVVGGAYLGWVWVPLYFDHYTVRQVVADYMNQAVKNPDDAQLRRDMVQKIRSLAQVDVVDEGGRPMRVPAVALVEQAVTWQRDGSTRSLRVAFEYERNVVYPVLDRTGVKLFTIDESNDISPPNWGPAR